MHIAVIIGTRPEAIKLAPLAALLGRDAVVIHTGQHHTAGMTGHLPVDHSLPPLHGLSRGAQLAAMTTGLDQAFRDCVPDAVIVQGDTTSALAGALAANATNTPLVHVEAGLRSFDRTMPEEHHRVLIDHLADHCCAPTPLARDNLLAERIPPERIHLTGNTIVEALASHLPDGAAQNHTLDQLGLTRNGYVLATIHRPENADDQAALTTILHELTSLPIPVVLPLHPRTQRTISGNGLPDKTSRLRFTGPLDYPTLLTLIRNSAITITDSGGIQEEATILKRPLLVIRRSNERPEAEHAFGARLPAEPGIARTLLTWLADLPAVQARIAGRPCPYGDGTASSQIAALVREAYRGRDVSRDRARCAGANVAARGDPGARPASRRSSRQSP